MLTAPALAGEKPRLPPRTKSCTVLVARLKIAVIRRSARPGSESRSLNGSAAGGLRARDNSSRRDALQKRGNGPASESGRNS